jgi:hypothetical protein
MRRTWNALQKISPKARPLASSAGYTSKDTESTDVQNDRLDIDSAKQAVEESDIGSVAKKWSSLFDRLEGFTASVDKLVEVSSLSLLSQ